MTTKRAVFLSIVAAAWLAAVGVTMAQEKPAPREKPPVGDNFRPGDDSNGGPQFRSGPPAQGPGKFGPPKRGIGEVDEGPRHGGPLDGRDPLGPGPGRGGPDGGPGLGPHPPGAPWWPRGDWESLKKSDPEMYELLRQDYDLDQESRELASQYRLAPEDQKEALQKQLEEVVARHFLVRQQRRELAVKRLGEELQRLRESIEQRTKGRDEIVKRRVSELLELDEKPPF